MNCFPVTIKGCTPDQKEYFDSLIEGNNAWGMYVLRQTIDPSTYTSLYNSFEKGTKGKYQRIVEELEKRGGEQFNQMSADLQACMTSDDVAGAKEIINELSNDELNLLKNSASLELNSFIAQSL